MEWLRSLIFVESAGQSILILCLIVALGLFLGRAHILGVSVGVIGVLAAGLLFGHFKIPLNHEVMDFARETGLILFVYTVGLQLGPSFLSSLRRQGLPLNLLAVLVVLGGVGVIIVLHYTVGLSMATGVGIYTGGVTNTPALGAAQEALRSFPDVSAATAAMPGLAYAMTYPFGVLGIIVSLLVLRSFFHIKISHEEEALAAAEKKDHQPLQTLNIVVRNTNLDGLLLSEIPGKTRITISRILQNSRLHRPTATTTIQVGDTILAVGRIKDLEAFRIIAGEASAEDLRTVSGPVAARRMLVTQKEVVGRKLGRLQDLSQVTITRLERNGVELIPNASLSLQIGDLLMVVGETQDLDEASRFLGNSAKSLQHLEVGPMFVGIALGILLGSIPVLIPGIPAAVKLGLAGGPLIVGMIVSHFGKVGNLVFFMPPNANLMLRETGILIFLACVGLKAGAHFVETLVHGPGLVWMGYGLLVTLVPLLLAGVLGRVVFKLNYLTLSGTLAGSMTDPPALAFANSLTKFNGPALAYATVYPLTMVLRLISAQVLILVFGP